MKYAMILVMILGYGLANAEEAQPQPSQGPHVLLTQIKHAHGEDVTIFPDKYPNGVFVIVNEMFGTRPVSAKIFAEKLRAKGFKIAASLEQADLKIIIRSSSIDFKEIDQDSDSMISGNKMDAAAGIAITAVVTGGLSLLTTDYSNLANSKPIYQSMAVFVQPMTAGSEELTTITTGAIKADTRNAKVTRAFFDIMADEWLKQHVRPAEASAALQPASAPVATQ